MKFYTKLPQSLKSYFDQEMKNAMLTLEQGHFKIAWKHLESAHIIGQRYPIAHSFVHWKMLVFGFKIKNSKEIMGQIPRLVFGGVKSFLGKVPVGNPGGANVPPLKAFPIEKELEAIFIKAGVSLDKC